MRRTGDLSTRLQTVFDITVSTSNGCLLVVGMQLNKGYPMLSYKGCKQTVARWLMLQAGHDMTGLVACHTCDNRRCVNIQHLYAGTHKQNSQDMIKDRTLVAGRNVSSTLWANEDIAYLLYQRGFSLDAIARLFDVKTQAVRRSLTRYKGKQSV